MIDYKCILVASMLLQDGVNVPEFLGSRIDEQRMQKLLGLWACGGNFGGFVSRSDGYLTSYCPFLVLEYTTLYGERPRISKMGVRLRKINETFIPFTPQLIFDPPPLEYYWQRLIHLRP